MHKAFATIHSTSRFAPHPKQGDIKLFAKFQSRVLTVITILKHRQRFAAFLDEHKRDKYSFSRQLGTWFGPDIARYTELANGVRGDFAEIGCYRGDTFSRLVPIAKTQGKIAHAFDSFEGMADPGPHDWRPKGQFAVGGAHGFHALMAKHGLAEDQYRIWPGFIPIGFNSAPASLTFSFALVDVDNYEPTRESLDWIWPRLSKDGILALDDFYPAHDGEASLAIKEFLCRTTDYHVVDLINAQLVLRKLT